MRIALLSGARFRALITRTPEQMEMPIFANRAGVSRMAVKKILAAGIPVKNVITIRIMLPLHQLGLIAEYGSHRIQAFRNESKQHQDTKKRTMLHAL